MTDSTHERTNTDGGEGRAKERRAASFQTSITDLEKPGRAVEPADPVPAARKAPDYINVGRPERFVSLIAGAALIAYGVSRKNMPGLALAAVGGGLAFRGIFGHCPAYSAAQFNTSAGDSRETKGIHIEESITIDSSPAELYGFWRNFENQALISEYLESVTVTGGTTSHWVAKGPADKPIEWDAEVINDLPNELIAWRTLPGADVQHAGTVRFQPAPNGSGTEVRVTMQYYPIGGKLGAGIALLMRREPSVETADTLMRLKRFFETGDVITVEGQPHGNSLSKAVFHSHS